MNLDEIRKNAPPNASHYGIEHDECGEIVIYLTSAPWGFRYHDNGLPVNEYEAYLLKIKPL